jgi:hypothetical protein
MYQQPPAYGYAPPPPQRSAIPKVIGILMIIFGSIGILGGLVGLAGGGMGGSQDLFREIPEFKTWRTIELLTSVMGLAISILQLYAGIRCVGYKANAVGMAKVYAILRMVTEIASAIIVYAWMKPMMEKVTAGSGMNFGGILGGAMIIGTLIGLAWPIVVLVLMSRPEAKDACNAEL